MTKLFVLFFSLLFASSSWALELGEKAPKSIEKYYLEAIDQLGNQAWLTHQRKLLQLIETYFPVTDEENSVLEYTTNKTGVCKGRNKSKTIYRLSRVVTQTENQVHYSIEHWACGAIRLTEEILVTGNGEYELTGFGAFTGLRDFHTPEGQTSIQYSVKNAHDQQLFHMYEENREDGRMFLMHIGESKLAEFHLDRSSQQALFTGFAVRANWKFGRGRYRISYGEGQNGMLGYLGNLGSVLFLGANSGLDRSVEEFQGFMSYIFIEPLTFGISGQFTEMNKSFFPESKFARAGSANDRMIEQLERLIGLLQSGQSQIALGELARIKKRFEDGEIRDLGGG